jgi:hypothetical protein
MSTFLVRIWMDDRPGALGAVASRVGAVRGDVIGIDIIDRGAGRAIDELVIDLPDPGLVDLLLAEIGEVEGVDVEHIRPLDAPPPDPSVTALGVARRVQAAHGPSRREELVAGAVALLGCDWAAWVDPDRGEVLATVGADLPTASWVTAFAAGATASADTAPELSDLAVAPLPGGQVLVVCRSRSPLRGREQAVLRGLAELVEDLIGAPDAEVR